MDVFISAPMIKIYGSIFILILLSYLISPFLVRFENYLAKKRQWIIRRNERLLRRQVYLINKELREKFDDPEFDISKWRNQ